MWSPWLHGAAITQNLREKIDLYVTAPSGEFFLFINKIVKLYKVNRAGVPFPFFFLAFYSKINK